jgi:CubicO group peptidase (beta-lactamase class C family)
MAGRVENNLNSSITALASGRQYPSIAEALTDRHDTLYVSTYSCSGMSARAPIGAETLFEVGSIGKSFTSFALLRQ